ncbi:MAG TPA: tetratricopeptide repeat protein [Kofleriaceae bacterium]|jgi:hypothetical protein
MRTTALFSTLALSLAAVPAVASADNTDGPSRPDQLLGPRDVEARKQLDIGVSAMETGEWDKAIKAFRAAVTAENAASEPVTPVLFYNLGQCFRHTGDTSNALYFYRRFLAEAHPTGKLLATVNVFVDQLESTRTAPPQGPASSAVEHGSPSIAGPVVPPPSPTTVALKPEPHDDTTHWYSDGVGWVLVGTGGVSGGISGVLFLQASDRASSAKSASTQLQANELNSQAHTRRVWGGIIGGASLVVLAAGVVKLALVPSGKSNLALSVAPLGNGLSLSGSF